jgi:hypothetical protein
MNVDPQSAQAGINLLANLTQLIALFRHERGARTDLTHREFIEWLEHHRHEEIKNLITETYHLQSQVDELLRQDHTEILAKLDAVNQIAVEILARMTGFSAFAEKVVPDVGMSDQAIGILRLLSRSKRGSMHMFPGGNQFLVDTETYSVTELRFLHDDLDALEVRGFISRDMAGKTVSYRITRRGESFVRLVKERPGETAGAQSKELDATGAELLSEQDLDDD